MKLRTILTSFVLFVTGLTASPVATAESPTHILLATDEGVKALNLATSELSLVLSGMFTGVAYDPRTKKIYASEGSTIERANLDGSGVETVFNIDDLPDEDYFTFYGLSIDSSTGNLYVMTYHAHILVCNTSGSRLACAPLVHLERMLFDGNAALVPQSSMMYFVSIDPPRIWRAGMDGSNVEVIFRDTSDPRGLTVDQANSKLYWTDFNDLRIMSSDLNGENAKTLVQLLPGSRPWGIAQLGNRIYWGNYHSYRLQSCDISGRDIRTHFTDTSHFYHIALVYSTSTEASGAKSLDGAVCSHINVPTPSKTIRCLCPLGMKLMADNTTCESLPPKPATPDDE